MHYNDKLDENIFKMLIQRNILLTDPNKKIKLNIYYNKSKTSSLVINNSYRENLLCIFLIPGP